MTLGEPPRRQASADHLQRRIEQLPAELSAALSLLQHRPPIPPLSPEDAPIWVSGGGMSEGPARFLCALLTERGLPAEYLPLSEFVASQLQLTPINPPAAAAPGARPPRCGTLVLFSQGLAPNARFPLLHHLRFRRCVLVTGVQPQTAAQAPLPARIAASAQAAGVQVLTLPPAEEEGLLLRVISPAVHCLAAAYLAGVAPSTLDALPAIYAQDAPPLSLRLGEGLPPVALVAGGRYLPACFGLRWKILEGLHLPDPPIWDLLQVAHGPLQSIWRRPHTLLLLSRAGLAHEASLWPRLAQVFAAPQHQLVSLLATRLPGSLAYFEHDAQLNGLIVEALRGENRASRSAPSQPEAIDLIDWPGRGSDGPLYGLAPDAADLVKLEHGADEAAGSDSVAEADRAAGGNRAKKSAEGSA